MFLSGDRTEAYQLDHLDKSNHEVSKNYIAARFEYTLLITGNEYFVLSE